jgi:alpha-galactosidase
MMNSPLILGNDLRSMPESTLKVLTNRAVIAINQDKLGVQAWKAIKDGQFEVWAKPLAGDEWAVLVLNRGGQRAGYTLDWAKKKISDDFSKRTLEVDKGAYQWVDAWTGKTGDTTKKLDLNMAPHSVTLLRLKKG